MTAPRSRAGECGQAALEVVALLPLVGAVALVLVQVALAGATAVMTGHAAQAGATALLQHRPALAAASAAVPGWVRRRMVVRPGPGEVSVVARPPVVLPGLGAALTTSAAASTGRPSS